ncbi:MAG: NgoFVII family restriction endonuclease [Alphaproteobacteria bacterium]|nr:NgoFVII family restriction endonuclease [Alphaproteobacteria bacterium]
MFFSDQTDKQKSRYENLLQVIGSLSKLSSDSDVPYLYYRMAENIFCKAFGADNLGRSDISLDAKKDNIGLGLKTFICSGTASIEKIAEFNKSKHLIDEATNIRDKIKIIADLRNERLNSTGGICRVDINDMYYHCVARDHGKLIIHETPIREIQINEIGAIKQNANIANFSDGIYDYSFNFSKSTLYKKFKIHPIHEIDVEILEDPYEILESKFRKGIIIEDSKIIGIESQTQILGTLNLPLYSERGDKNVPEKSGLNQWNASGRRRDPNEIYISVPMFIHNNYPNFFPKRDTPFKLKLPSGQYLEVKICQDNGKALMSNPNKALGKWLLRDVLKLRENELLTYEKLEKIGIDSIEINKLKDGTFEINFKQLGTYEDFVSNTKE